MARPVGHRVRQEQKLLDLLTSLNKKRRFSNPTTAWLAKKLKVSTRSIERYMAGLRSQGLLQATYMSPKLYGNRWVTKRYVRVVTPEFRASWAPVSAASARAPLPSRIAAPTATVTKVKVAATSWAKPWYGAPEDHPNVRMKELYERIAAVKALPKPPGNPKAEFEARSRLFKAAVNPDLYRSPIR